MRLILLAIVVWILAGCSAAPNLPATDTIIKVKPTELGLIANSEKYSYRFYHKGTPQEYQRYQRFYDQYHQASPGVRVNFRVNNNEVVAEYWVILNKNQLTAAQQSILTDEYKAQPWNHDQLRVLFKTTGFWLPAKSADIEESWRLPSPIVVSINDKTQTLNSVGMVALVPIFPLVMMYGCAVGPCL